MIDPTDDLTRAVEATLFAAEAPQSVLEIAAYMGADADVRGALRALQERYEARGINLVERGGRWHFQTAPDLAHILRREREETRKLSRAGIETLAIIAYHEPVSRVRPAGRREVPGRPLTYATTPGFLAHFGLENRRDLPGIDDLRAAGLLDPVDLAFESLEMQANDADQLETVDESD
jgi:segregation and condensation protein B